RTPDAVALVFEGRQLTYRELNSRANQLAHYLTKRGVGPDVPVGICVDRSPEMVVGLLGILKAGGAYVPLDADYPLERLQFMIRDTGIKILLAQQRPAENLPSDIGEVFRLDADWHAINSESDHNLTSGAGAGNLAYIMYTSGSTGTPKGVEIPHRGIVRLVINNDYARFHSSETYLQLASLSFDASTFELWAPLLHGASCVIFPPGIPTPERLAEAIRSHKVSTLWLTASLFNLIINESPDALRGISQLLIGGEQLSTLHVCKAQKELQGTQIINGYGPTESTTFTCCYSIPEGIAPDTNLPIGRPIANTRVYILDANLNPLPVGIPGELYIGGDGLARGYLNRPELTAEKFIADPFSTEPGSRLYKTGDLVRYRSDGNIEYLGRMDFQVKIRGFRIELEEIEATLGQHPGIRAAVVIMWEFEPGDKQLVAYVVTETKDAPTVSPAELRLYLQGKLPAYMIPSVFITLDTMQLTSSGKIDRRALPAPDHSRPETQEGYVAPRSPIEETLAAIWSEVLGVERIGIHDNFFELGGHSLLATKLFSQIAVRLGKRLPVSALFRAPTIEGIAAALEKGQIPSAGSSIMQIQQAGTNPTLFIVHGLGGDVFLARQLANHLGADQPVCGFHSASKNLALMKRGSLEELAAHYIKDLLMYKPQGPYCLAGYSFGGYLAYEIARQLSHRGLRVGHLAIIDTGPSSSGELSIPEIMARILRIVRNFPWWIWEDLLDCRPIDMLKRIRRKLRELKKRVIKKPALNKNRNNLADLEDIFELESFPEDYVQTMEHNLELLKTYIPGPYPGPLTLYRARTQALFNHSKADLGWKRLVDQGLEIIRLPGNHETIINKPYVQALAEALRNSLDKVRS
ncbi:MAG: amino acid adenylation domain-containing protein, partial [Acidobacteria bacterium]|nr:amino acid adenylation domain-containing protein [Acidobacteriota bacterium]